MLIKISNKTKVLATVFGETNRRLGHNYFYQNLL